MLKISNSIIKMKPAKTMSPNDFGKKYLTEECRKIILSDFTKKAKQQIKKMVLKSSLEAVGCNIDFIQSKTGFGGIRYWFSCPICHKRSGVIYIRPISHVLGCRKCLKLDYRKHRYKGMIEEKVIKPNESAK